MEKFDGDKNMAVDNKTATLAGIIKEQVPERLRVVESPSSGGHLVQIDDLIATSI